MKHVVLVLLCLLLSASAYGQFTTVSGTITDAGGQAWNNGTYNFSFKVSPSNPSAQYIFQGAPFSSSQTIQGNLDGSAHFSVSVPANASITPSGSTWVLTVCPAATATNGCYSLAFGFATGSQNISTAVIPPAVQVSMAIPPAGASAYNDAEITQAKTGNLYFNLTDSTLHICAGFPPCTWLSVSGGGGSLLPSNNTWTGTNAFSNSVFLNSGGAIAGSWSGNSTITGNWNFINTITGAISGNSGTTTAFATPPTQCSTNFSTGITSTGNTNCRNILAADVPTLNQNTTGNAATATNATNAVTASTALALSTISGLPPGSNGQCTITSGGGALWGSCAGTAGVQALSVNSGAVNVTGTSAGTVNLMSYTFSPGVLNTIGKTFRVTAYGILSVAAINDQAWPIFSFSGSVLFPAASLTGHHADTSFHSWKDTFTCSVTATGSSGQLQCSTDETIQLSNNGTSSYWVTEAGIVSVNLTASVPLIQQLFWITNPNVANNVFQYQMIVELLN